MEAELSRIMRAVRRFWWIPLLLALILAPATWAVGRSLSETYVARSQIMVTPLITGSTSITTESNRTETYLQLVKSGPVLDSVIVELGLDLTRQELGGKIETQLVNGTNIFEIQVRDADPELAAEINNSVARHVEARVADLTLGQMQRNLDELTFQSEELRSRLVVLDTRLSTLDVPENAADSEIQAEINAIRSERLLLQQTIADIDATTRELNSAIVQSVTPIAIIDSAMPPRNPEGASPMVLATLGALIGIGAGALIGLWREYRDRTIWDKFQLEQVIGKPVLASLTAGDLNNGDSSKLQMLRARLNAWSQAHENPVAVVSPRSSEPQTALVGSIQTEQPESQMPVIDANGLLDRPEVMMHMTGPLTASVVLVELGQTQQGDLIEIVSFLEDVGSPVIGTVVVNRS